MNIQNMMELAQQSIQQAYIPKGRNVFKVGAVLCTKDNVIYKGANVKLACGLTMCAERIALYNAIVQEGANLCIDYIVLAHNQNKMLLPCGCCLEAMSSFTKDETQIIYHDDNNVLAHKTFKEILPYAFHNGN